MTATKTVPSKKGFSYHLKLGDVDYGWWDGPAVKLGGDFKRDRDPELGEVLVGGGAKTGDTLPLSRLWQDGRDDLINGTLVDGRLTLEGNVGLYRVDAVGQPTSATPIRSMPCLLTEASLPEADSKSGEANRHEIAVEVVA